MKRFFVLSTFAVSTFMSLNCTAGFAATIEGALRDEKGNLQTAGDLILHSAVGITAHTSSDVYGKFIFRDVPVGTYTVEAVQGDVVLGSAAVTVDNDKAVIENVALQAGDPLHVAIMKQRDDARNNLSPRTGTNAYKISDQAIAAMPQGTNASFDKVLEQAPGVAIDSYGQTHVRGEHANLQYRLNGILLPEGISGFGQVLDSQLVASSTLLDGALPAQYGYRTSGVVDIVTKSGFENGGQVSMYGGSQNTFQPSVQYGGSVGNADYFVSASHLSSDLGIENPTSSRTAIHDHTDQDKQFAYMSYALDPYQRVDIIAGNSTGHFQIPNNPGQATNFTLNGVSNFDSSQLNERQNESNQYMALAWQAQHGEATWQIAPYFRYSDLTFRPDVAGDLMFSGIATDIDRSNLALGLQGDGSYNLNNGHTLRSGFSFQHEHAVTYNTSYVFETSGGMQSSFTPDTIVDNNQKDGVLYGLYLQDEWKLGDHLTVNYGARFDVVDAYTNENQLSPRLGVVYKVDDATTLHAGYARYFTPPPLELIANSSVSKFVGTTGESAGTQNDPVKAERSHTFDVGVAHKLNDKIQLGLDGYYKIVRNMLDEGQFGQALVYTPFNYARGHIYGMEATASYTGERLNAYGNLAVSRAMGTQISSAQFNFDPDELAYIDSHYVHLDHDQTYTASMGASYRILDATTVGMDGVLGSGLREGFANTEHLPLYTQFDASVTQDLDIVPKHKTSVRLSVVNIFDTSYELRDGTGIGVGAPQWGPRRGVFMGLTQAF